MGTGVQILAVSHTGIKLLQMARGSREASGQLRVLRTYRCWQRVKTGPAGHWGTDWRQHFLTVSPSTNMVPRS